MAEAKRTSPPVDGGYGWVMVVVCFLIGVFVVDNFGSLGVFMVECGQSFEMSTTDLTWIGGFRISLLGLLGVTVGDLLGTYSGRMVLISGTLLVFTGHCGAALLPQLGFWWLLFTYGILAGVGACCQCVVMVSSFQEYFDKHRGMANAIVYAGYSVGFFTWSPLLKTLFSYYGCSGGLVIDAGLHLHGIALALLIIPAGEYYNIPVQQDQDNPIQLYVEHDHLSNGPSHDKEVTHSPNLLKMYELVASSSSVERCFAKNNLQKLQKETKPSLSNSMQFLSSSLMSLAMDKRFSVSHNHLDQYTHDQDLIQPRGLSKGDRTASDHPDMNKDSIEFLHGSCCKLPKQGVFMKCITPLARAVGRAFDFSLLKDFPFCIYCIGMALVHLGNTAPLSLVVLRAVEEGIDKTTASFLMSIYGICLGVSTPFWGFAADCSFFSQVPTVLCGIPAVFIGFGFLMFFKVTSHTAFLVFASFWGFLAGALNLQSVMVSYLLGLEKMAKGAGTMYSVIGVAWLITYFLSGILIAAFGNTVQPFFVLGAIQLTGGLVVCTIPMINRYFPRPEKT